MSLNKDLITHFYSSFQKKDYASMQECYADTAVFSDPVFPHLTASEVRAMWEMFCKAGQDLNISYSHVEADGDVVTAQWAASYTFSLTGRPVTNHIRATFGIRNGKIIQHADLFNFHKWAWQALGSKGLLLGWTPFVKSKVRATARHNLDAFIHKSRSQ